jgi:hypothetical protein
MNLQFILRSEATKDLVPMCAAQVGARSFASLRINS